MFFWLRHNAIFVILADTLATILRCVVILTHLPLEREYPTPHCLACTGVLLTTAMLPAKSEASTRAFVTLRVIVLLIVIMFYPLVLLCDMAIADVLNISDSYMSVK
jgi:hypothetical protein